MIAPATEWLYLPPIESADLLHTLDDGVQRIELYHNLKSAGAIEYRYMIGVYPSGTSMRPRLLVTCERSAGLELEYPGQFALGVFTPQGHHTLAIGKEYGQWNIFLDKSAEVISTWLPQSGSVTS